MATYPYISGPGNITQIILLLRKNFPSSVTSDTVKKYGLASNNESYVINALQFLGIIGEDGKRTDVALDAFSKHSDTEFQAAFGKIVREAYKDLFDLWGDGAWTLGKSELVGFFRSADKTSDVIGARQASVFQVFAGLSGYENVAPVAKPKTGAKNAKKASPPAAKAPAAPVVHAPSSTKGPPAAHAMALTVRVEINLPAGGSKETYDNIFKSIKENLLND